MELQPTRNRNALFFLSEEVGMMNLYADKAEAGSM